MTGRLDGRAAIVTGAATGIGRAVAERLAADGARVIVLDIAEAEAARLADRLGNGARFIAFDVTRESNWAGLARELRLDRQPLFDLRRRRGAGRTGVPSREERDPKHHPERCTRVCRLRHSRERGDALHDQHARRRGRDTRAPGCVSHQDPARTSGRTRGGRGRSRVPGKRRSWVHHWNQSRRGRRIPCPLDAFAPRVTTPKRPSTVGLLRRRLNPVA